MRKKKLRILSTATAMAVMFATYSGAMSVSAFEDGQSVGIGTVTSSSNRPIDGDDSGLNYSEAVITGTTGTEYDVHTVTFNPQDSDYLPFVYSKFSGYGSPVLPSGQNAEEKGYDIKAGVNGSLYYMYSGSTYAGVGISDGKIIQGDNSWGSQYVLAFNSDGTAQIVYSHMEYTLELNDEEQPEAMGHINIRPAPESASGDSMKTDDKIYYFDTSCGTATDSSIDGVEVIFEKIDNTDLVVGGTLVGRVKEVRENTSGNEVASNEFILYARNSSEWASVLSGLQVGDIAQITCEETQPTAKEAMEKCNSSLVIYGDTYPLVADGQNVASRITGLPNTPRPRTGIGIKADGTMVLFAVEGDNNTGYVGMTLTEFADLMISQDIVTGINFDGGGSTQMTVENDSGTLESLYDAGGRYVANSVFVIKRPTLSDDLYGNKPETLADLIDQTEALKPTAESLNYAKEVYETATSMPGDYTKAIMALQEELGRLITTDLPSNVTGILGTSLTLSIEASPIGGGTLSYQWYKDNVAIEDATGPSYTIDSVTESDGGSYKVVVTNTIAENSITQTSTACTVEISDGNNIVSGLKYTTSLRDGGANAGLGDFHDDHPDVERTKLTDGLYATSWSDSNTVGYNARNWEPVDITFHLGDSPKSFQQINIGAFSPNNSGIQLQSNTKIEIKNGADDEWHVICDSPTAGSLGVDKRFVFSTEQGKIVVATDIRFTLELGSSWLFLDEIEILRDADGTTPDDILTGSEPTSTVETPVINTNLETAQSVTLGESLTLTVAASVSDGGTLTYQWYKDDQAISDATGTSFTIESIEESDAGSYKVVVTNTLNGETASATSNVCAVTVETATPVSPETPVFTSNLGSTQSVTSGESLTLAVEASVSDGGTLSYQWYKDDQTIPGATSASFTIDSVDESDKGSYKVEVTNTLNGETATATSNICAVTVTDLAAPVVPTFTSNLATAQSVDLGESLTLTVEASVSDGGTLSYQWYKDDQAIAGATSASFTIDSVEESDGGSYKVEVTNTLNGVTSTATSNVCVVTIQTAADTDAPTITADLASSRTVEVGDQVNFSVTAASNNNGTLSYQWYKNGREIDGATGASYVIRYASTEDSGVYYVVVMDNSNNTRTTSNSCTLEVEEQGGSSNSGSGDRWWDGSSSRPSKPSEPSEPETPSEPSWEQVDGGWKLKGTDGSYLTGWQRVDGSWYYLRSNGMMATGWFQDGSTWYYLKPNGAMATGWLKLGNVWYYLRSSGAMQTGWLYDGGVWYWFYDWGGMANTSWVKVNTNENGYYTSKWYYFRGNGAMQTGWLQLGGTWYYLRTDGSMVHDRWMLIDGKYYYFYSSGAMASNTTVGGYQVGANGQWIQ